MRAPDTPLVRARAKAPLADLEVLHLSTADLTCLQNLEACRQLRSLYANANLIRDVEGLAALRCLWRIDLSDNHVKNIKPLASFVALGYLNLERNGLGFADLVCLRDIHLVELRLSGNRTLVEDGRVVESRKKLVALLPYAWILDGHFITTLERAEALEDCDGFVAGLLLNHEVGGGRFGATSELWNGPLDTGFGALVQAEVVTLLDIVSKQPSRQPVQQDLYRLRTIAVMHDREADVHNRHIQFAPSKHLVTGQRIPQIRVQHAMALSRRARLELFMILATQLEFSLPAKLVRETVVIILISDGCWESDATAQWAEDLTRLPPYANVALLTALWGKAIDEAHAGARPVTDKVWTRTPPVHQTLLKTQRQSHSAGDESLDHQDFELRCAMAVSLLSRASSFPVKPEIDELALLVDVAKMAGTNGLEQLGFTIPPIFINNPTVATKTRPRKDGPARSYRKPWMESSSSIGTITKETDTGTPLITAKVRLPKRGEWIEIAPRRFLQITTVSTDAALISASAPSNSAVVVTLPVDHIARVSASMWRVHVQHQDAVQQQLVQHLALPSSLGHSNTRLGKLHRDNEGFHKHGAARNQGFPNLDITERDLVGSDHTTSEIMSPQPSSIQVFSSDDTLDANYVLTSPGLVRLQNECAARRMEAQHRPPAGLWNPIQCALFKTVGSDEPVSGGSPTHTGIGTGSVKTKTNKQPSDDAASSVQHDDWESLQRDMRTLLGLDSSSTNQLLRAHEDADLFITKLPDTGSPRLQKCASTPLLSLPAPYSPSALKSPSAIPKPKRLAALPWHQVATKPLLRVDISSVTASFSGATVTSITCKHVAPLSPESTATDTQGEPPSASRPPSAVGGRVPLRLTKCRVSLPTLPLQSQNEW